MKRNNRLTDDDTKVTTSHGRTKHFAPFEDSRQQDAAVNCRWIRVSSEQVAQIVGIFIDLVKYSRGGSWNIIGFTQNIEQHRNDNDSAIPPIPEVYAATALLPKPFRASPDESRYILSTASLNNVSSLRMRRRDGRCIGLFLRYKDSTTETLGQWDPLDQNSISLLYDAADGILMRLNFHTAREVLNNLGGTRVIMKDITVEVTGSPWEYQAPEEQPAGTDPLAKSFDCYRPKQVSKSKLDRFSQNADIGFIYSGLHGGLGISTKTCLRTTIGPKCT